MRACDVTIMPKALRDLRRAKYWTQDELSSASGLSIRTIQRAERSGAVSLSTLKALSAVFEVDVAELEGANESSKPERTKKPMRFAGLIALAIVVLGYLLIDISGNWGSSEFIETVAILPFASRPTDPKLSELADTLTHELIRQLTQSQNAKVVPERVSRSVAGSDSSVSEIGKALSASLIVEGVVYANGDRFLVTIQVFDVASSSVQWSESYSRNPDEILTILDSVAKSIEAVLRN